MEECGVGIRRVEEDYGLCSGWFAREVFLSGAAHGQNRKAAEYGTLTEAPVRLESSRMRESSHLTVSMNWK